MCANTSDDYYDIVPYYRKSDGVLVVRFNIVCFFFFGSTLLYQTPKPTPVPPTPLPTVLYHIFDHFLHNCEKSNVSFRILFEIIV